MRPAKFTKEERSHRQQGTDVSLHSLQVYRKLLCNLNAIYPNRDEPVSIETALKGINMDDNRRNRMAVGRAFRQLGFEKVRLQRYLKNTGGVGTRYGFMDKETFRLARQLMTPMSYDDSPEEPITFD